MSFTRAESSVLPLATDCVTNVLMSFLLPDVIVPKIVKLVVAIGSFFHASDNYHIYAELHLSAKNITAAKQNMPTSDNIMSCAHLLTILVYYVCKQV